MLIRVAVAPRVVWEAAPDYVGETASESVMPGILMLLTARLFVDYEIAHTFWMACLLVLTAATFSLFVFIR